MQGDDLPASAHMQGGAFLAMLPPHLQAPARQQPPAARAVKQRWSAAEDQMLRDAVAANGAQNWQHIASFLPNRNEKQARERWMNQLRPGVSKAEWTPAEDARVVQLFQQLGSSWAEIARLLPGRSDQMVKNRFNNHLRKGLLPSAPDPSPLDSGGGGGGGAAGASRAQRELGFSSQMQGSGAPAATPMGAAEGPRAGSAARSLGLELPPASVSEEAMRLAAVWSTPPHHLLPPQPAMSSTQLVQGVPIPEPRAPPPSKASAVILHPGFQPPLLGGMSTFDAGLAGSSAGADVIDATNNLLVQYFGFGALAMPEQHRAQHQQPSS